MRREVTPARRNTDDSWKGSWLQRLRQRHRLFWRLSLLAVAFALVAGGRHRLAELPKWQARNALQAREADRALKWLSAAEWLSRHDPEIEFLKARAFRRKGELDRVRNSLLRAYKLGFPLERVEREQWLAMAQAGQLREAGPHLAELLVDPQGDAAEICEAYTTGLIRTHRIDEAFPLVRSWEADSPDDPLPPLTEAKLWIELGQMKDAEKPLVRALRLDPECHEAAYYLALVHQRALRFDKAIELFRRCAKQMPAPQDRSRAGVGYAQCLRSAGKPEEARQIVADILREDPGNREALIELGRVELEVGRYSEAVAAFEKAGASDSHDIEVRYAWAGALRSAGRLEEARHELQKLEIAQEALARTTRLLERVRTQPDDIESRLEAGKIFLQHGDAEKGITWLLSILQFVPEHEEAKRLIANYYASKAGEDPRFAELAIRYGHASDSPSAEARLKTEE